MHRKIALRVGGLGVVLAMVAATTDPALGSSVSVDGYVSTTNGGSNFWDEFIPVSALGTYQSVHGTMLAEVSSSTLGTSSWAIGAGATAAASEVYRGASANAGIFLQVTDRITAQMPAGSNLNHVIRYNQHLHIEGATSGSASSPGEFTAAVEVRVQKDNTTLLYSAETLTNTGYLETMPRGDVVFVVQFVPSAAYDLRITIGASALGSTIENAGVFDASADFSHTFRWGEVTDVFNVTTGQPIPAEDFHLYGADGFDWAHPPAIPEPATLGMIGFAAATLLLRRSRRRR